MGMTHDWASCLSHCSLEFYIGYRRGLFMQAYYVVSVIIAMGVAAYFYQPLGEAINLLGTFIPIRLGMLA